MLLPVRALPDHTEYPVREDTPENVRVGLCIHIPARSAGADDLTNSMLTPNITSELFDLTIALYAMGYL